MRTNPNPLKSFLSACSLALMLAAATLATAEDAQLRWVSQQQLLGADFAKAKVVGLVEGTVIRDKDGVERRGVVAMLISDGKPVTMGSWPAKDLRSGRTTSTISVAAATRRCARTTPTGSCTCMRRTCISAFATSTNVSCGR